MAPAIVPFKPQTPATPTPAGPALAVGFATAESFAHLQRVALMFSQSAIVPELYRGDEGVANCVIALDIAARLGASPLAVMQNLYTVHGKPGWSSTWIIASVNACGRFEPIRFELTRLGPKTVAYEYTVYRNHQKSREKGTVTVDDVECVAWAVDQGASLPPGVSTLGQAREENVPLYESPPVTIEMAVKEGWYTKLDSKWKTMPLLMLRYRAATLFGRLYAPEILVGLKSVEELQDLGVMEVETDPPPPPSRLMPRSKRKDNLVATPTTSPAETSPKSEPAAHVETTPQAEPTTVQGQLAAWVESNGFTWAQFREWGEASGNVPVPEGGLNSYADLHEVIARRLLRSKTGLVDQLRGFVKGAS